ncbi:polyprenyl synthetase family protein [Roseibium suaedae]|uniref:Probable farnesyl diphosphate synthase n=1 Tax=Roseibium suaedae TaxID=735517 RepID=A0A1M7MLQ1_9HYPH|nr:farnesyl diphosphate synthase [Roseibium suaedae]
MTIDIKQLLAARADQIETVLKSLLSSDPLDHETARPARLLEAMRYASLGGGKRLRPLLVLEVAALFGRDLSETDKGPAIAGSALEFIHCYSLVHDDLPAMDDDDLRRGQPTVHKAFDEATAILAGDALLTLAFDVIAEDVVHADAAVRLRLSRDLARASGIGGMAGGQMLDLESENRDRTETEIRTLQAMKTGALIRYACRAGAILANAPEEDVARMTRFGEIIGLAFQLADDLLDVEGSAEDVGKATGKDAAAGKATLVGLLGVPQTRAELAQLMRDARELLAPYGARAEALSAIAAYVAERKS